MKTGEHTIISIPIHRFDVGHLNDIEFRDILDLIGWRTCQMADFIYVSNGHVRKVFKDRRTGQHGQIENDPLRD